MNAAPQLLVGSCREIKLQDTAGNFSFKWTDRVFGDAHPEICSCSSNSRSGMSRPLPYPPRIRGLEKMIKKYEMFFFWPFSGEGLMWTVAFNVSVRAQGYYGSIKLVSEDWYISQQWLDFRQGSSENEMYGDTSTRSQRSPKLTHLQVDRMPSVEK
jgi:hypothetical protein